MTFLRAIVSLSAVLALTVGAAAQDYKPFTRACVVCLGEIRPGWTAQYQHEGQIVVIGFCSSPCRTKFLQSPATHFANALAAFKAGKKDKKVAADATGPCDLKRVVKTPWCLSCTRELGKDDLLPSKVCKRCETKPLQAEFCVKVGDVEDRARVTYKCESCAAAAELESEFKHEAGCKPKLGGGLKKVCSKSGMSPHATDTK